MKNYTSTIIVCSLLLLLFPFISLSEFWEYLYVIIPAFIICFSALKLSRSLGIGSEGQDVDSLEEYIQKLQARFKQEEKKEKNKRSEDNS